ncbi:MAG: molecular chaperone HtpG [Stagnimonas sp.]|nr:molecular chaperone HtpG [Stagnimonas sp.]
MTATVETKEFQAETKQVLKLVIHSLYSHKEIFLRELISNASDACEKLRFEALKDSTLLGGDTVGITLIPDAAAGTLTIKDNGIGMSRDEVVENLGTIARSGTKKFLEALSINSGDGAKDSQLIGQFGVGFYSAFIVADKVTVLTKRSDSEGVRWDSDGEGSYEIGPHHKSDRGTEVILHLRADDKEYLDADTLTGLVHKYSDHLALPISLTNDDKTEVINQAKAFWTRPKSELKDEDYQAFYKHISHDWDDALAWAHHKVEGTLEYTSLVYIPKRAPFDMFNRDEQNGVQLYVKRVFIMDKAAELLPPYLRFVRGLVDSADLPLNVSRELLQGSRTTDKIKTALTKRILDLLDDVASNKPEQYAEFWKTFGTVLKEGMIDDAGNKERIAKLLRFTSTHALEGQTVTLADYISRMKPEQKGIYYVTGDTVAAAKNSPQLEGFLAQGFEVLLLTDRIDEWLTSHLHEFEGKKLESVARAAKDIAPAIETPEKAANESAFKETLERLKTALAGKISEAKISVRLTESPACLVAGEYGMSLRMERMMKAAGQSSPFGGGQPVFEINAEHPLVQRLKDLTDEAAFTDLAGLLHDQAVLAEGGQLDDPASFVKRLNKLILDGLSEQPRIQLS